MNTTSTQSPTQTAPVAASAATRAEQDMSIAAIAQSNRALFDTLIAAMSHPTAA